MNFNKKLCVVLSVIFVLVMVSACNIEVVENDLGAVEPEIEVVENEADRAIAERFAIRYFVVNTFIIWRVENLQYNSRNGQYEITLKSEDGDIGEMTVIVENDIVVGFGVVEDGQKINFVVDERNRNVFHGIEKQITLSM